MSLEYLFASIISSISYIHIHPDCQFTEQKLKVKKSNPSRSEGFMCGGRDSPY